MFGVKFKEAHLHQFARRVSDYMQEAGEAVLIENNHENIPLKDEINSVGFFSSKKLKNKQKIRNEFDLGVIWVLAFKTFDTHYDYKHFYKFIKKGLKYCSKYSYNESPSLIYKMVYKIGSKHTTNMKYEDPLASYQTVFSSGVRFGELFVRRFYEHDFED